MASEESGRTTWLWVAGAVVVALVVGAVVYVTRPKTEYSGPKDAPRILIIGDSITQLAQADIDKTFGGKTRLLVHAKWGKRSDQMLAPLKDGLNDPAGRPAAVILNLGTNDALQHRDAATADYLKAVQAAEKAPCVVLTNITALPTPADNAVADELNATMSKLAASQPKVHIADWRSLATSNPQLMVPPDNFHPTVSGRTALAELYLQSLRSCPNHPVP